MLKWTHSLLILSVVLCLVGCQIAESAATQPDKTETERAVKLQGYFVLTWIIDDERTSPKRRPRIEINTTTNQITGGSGCNQFSGNVQFDGDDKISISKIGSTKMYCPGSGEDHFFACLERITNYTQNGLELIFFAGDEPIIKFKKVD